MKKIFLLTAMLLTILAACDNPSGMDMNKEVQASFTASVGKQKPSTRMADTQWDSDDCIGIFALNDDCADLSNPNPEGTVNTYANGKYKYSGAAWSFESSSDVTKPYYFKNPYTTVVTFKAYYPWQPNNMITAAGAPKSIDNGTIAVDASADQSLDAQKKYDFLFAEKAPDATGEPSGVDGKPWGSKESTKVKFQFTHSMVKLVFVLKPSATNGVSLEAVKKMIPTLKGIKSKGTFSLANGVVTASADAATDLVLKNKFDVKGAAPNATVEGVQFVALVVPQTTPTDATLSLAENVNETDTNTYLTKKIFSGLADGLQAGHQYTYTLTVKKMELVVESFGITDWQNTDMGDADDAVLQ